MIESTDNNYFSTRQKGNHKGSHSVRLKTRKILWLSRYSKFRSRTRPCIDSRSIFRNVQVLEMSAVQFSYCGNLRYHNEEINRKKNTCAYLGALYSQNYLRLFLLDSQRTYCEHFQTIGHIFCSEIIQSLTAVFIPVIWRNVLLQ